MSRQRLIETAQERRERRQKAHKRNQEHEPTTIFRPRVHVVRPARVPKRKRYGQWFSRTRTVGIAASARVGIAGLLHPLLPDLEDYAVEVSVIFGTYERLSHLKRCVESVCAACSGLSYEIVICDGGSKDGTVEWLQDQSDVVLLHGRLNGAVEAFNACFARARGRYILNLNDDAVLDPNAVRRGLKYFDDPRTGQVALGFSIRNQSAPIVQQVRGVIYANYGITKANVAREIARICGGFWAPCYYTYGGDNELSMWVSRLGYRIVAALDAVVLDLHAMDALRRRSNNHENGKSGITFSTRWPNEACVHFRGPQPGLTNTELKELQKLEEGEPPHARWERLELVEPEPGQFPPRAKFGPERVLHVYLRTDEDPQESQRESLKRVGSAGHAIVDWLALDPHAREREIAEAAAQLQPTLMFVQVQGPHVSANVIRQIRSGRHDPALVVVFWCGDVGTNNGPWEDCGDGWAHVMAKEVDAMLYTGTGQVEIQRARGMRNAAYLQIGFDESRYFPPTNDVARHGIVFLGQNYASCSSSRPTKADRVRGEATQLRRNLVQTFQRNFSNFEVYGPGWKRARSLHQSKAGGLYRQSLLALSVSMSSELGRYTSDRMIRSMACGTPTLVKGFPDMAGMGLRHGDNVLVWDTLDQAVSLAKEWTSPSRRSDLLELGRRGARLMREHHTWGVRMDELAAIVRALRGYPA